MIENCDGVFKFLNIFPFTWLFGEAGKQLARVLFRSAANLLSFVMLYLHGSREIWHVKSLNRCVIILNIIIWIQQILELTLHDFEILIRLKGGDP